MREIINNMEVFKDIQNFENKYNIDSRIYRHSKMKDLNRGFRIWLNTLNTNKFMNLIVQFYNLVPSMQYNFTKYYSL